MNPTPSSAFLGVFGSKRLAIEGCGLWVLSSLYHEATQFQEQRRCLDFGFRLEGPI